MADFDYGNARLRAMRARLLSPDTLRSLASSGSIASLIGALDETPYAASVEAALAQFSGLDCLNAAWRSDLVETMHKVRSFFTDDAAALVAVALRRYDVFNLRTILRGLAQQRPADEMLALVLPVGDLRPAALEALAQTPDPRAAIDLLATWQAAAAAPLMEVRARRPGANLLQMEMALERWYWSGVLAADARSRIWQETMALGADVTNLMTALRLVGRPDVAPLLEELADGANDVQTLFVGPGTLSFEQLAHVVGAAGVETAVSLLADTPYASPLRDALPQYHRTRRLSQFERALQQLELDRAVQNYLRDPLGIGIFLGYIALKTNEIGNLRTISQGVFLQQSAEEIRKQLLLPGEGN